MVSHRIASRLGEALRCCLVPTETDCSGVQRIQPRLLTPLHSKVGLAWE